MSEQFEKPGITRPATDSDHTWVMGLGRYVRNMHMTTPHPSGRGTNITPMFNGLSSRLYPGELCVIFNSFRHTDHARYIEDETEQARQAGELHLPNVDLEIGNTFSREVTLRMQARAYEVTDPEEKREALTVLNGLRRIKRLPPIDPRPQNDEDESRSLYVARVLRADIQGERFSARGNHVGEGHPVLDIAKLQGFEDLPRYLWWGGMPKSKKGLERYLRLAKPLQQLRILS